MQEKQIIQRMLFYINTETHEVHRSDCVHLPTTNKKFLGSYNSLKEAVKEAKKSYSDADACGHCEQKEK